MFKTCHYRLELVDRREFPPFGILLLELLRRNSVDDSSATNIACNKSAESAKSSELLMLLSSSLLRPIIISKWSKNAESCKPFMDWTACFCCCCGDLARFPSSFLSFSSSEAEEGSGSGSGSGFFFGCLCLGRRLAAMVLVLLADNGDTVWNNQKIRSGVRSLKSLVMGQGSWPHTGSRYAQRTRTIYLYHFQTETFFVSLWDMFVVRLVQN